MAIVYTAFIAAPTVNLFFCTGNGFADDNAMAFWEPRIIQPGLLRSEIRIDGIFGGGQASSSIGEIVLANADGALDYIRDHALDGSTCSMEIIDDETLLVVDGNSIAAKIKTVRYDWKTVTIVLRDDTAELASRPLHTARYLGNNSGGNGMEGTPADVQDLVKPILLGAKTNLPTVLVNSGKLIYQAANDITASSLLVTGVYDGGFALTNAGGVANLDTAAAPAANTFITDTSGRFRLGVAPARRVTCNAQVVLGAGDIIRRLAIQGGHPSGLISASDVTAANTDFGSASSPYYFSNSEKTAGEALNEFCSGFGYFWYIDVSNNFRFSKLTAPSGSPVLVLNQDNIVEIDIADSGDVPVNRVTCRYDQNLAVMERNELAAGLSETTIQAFGLEYRKQSASTTGTHPTSGEYVFEATTTASATAATLASTRLTLQSVDRLKLRVVCNVRSITTPALGAVVQVVLPRFGMSAGKLFRVIGTEHDWRRNNLELILWG